MISDYAKRAVKRPGQSHCYSTRRLKAFWLRSQPAPMSPPATTVSISSDSPFESLPEFPGFDSERAPPGSAPASPLPLEDAASEPPQATALPNLTVALPGFPGSESDSEHGSVTSRSYKRCFAKTPACIGHDTGEELDVLDHEALKQKRTKARAHKLPESQPKCTSVCSAVECSAGFRI